MVPQASQAATARVLAPAVRTILDEEPVPVAVAGREPTSQRRLFTSRELGRVVPIEMFQPPASDVARPKARRRTLARDSGFGKLHQETLRFGNASQSEKSPGVRPRQTSRVPVAVPMHRVVAGVLDTSLVLIAVGIMALVVHLMVGMEFYSTFGMWALAAMGLVVGFGYKLMWIAAGTESPGLTWAQLRLVNFDGAEPTQRERLERFAWTAVSLLPGGLGLLWALVDEETLTWHDHSSKTFVTCLSTVSHA